MLVSSIHGTNKVEGGLLSEAEVKQIIEHDASVISSDNEKRRVLNLKNAYDYAENTIENYQHHLNDGSNSLLSSLSLAATPITEKHIFNLHRLAMAGLMSQKMSLVNYRSRTNYAVKVGDSEHGGIYTPPICFEDIQKLMKVLLEWLNSESVRSLSVLYTAPLLHFYFEKIHPFADGNGRVGRILEAMQLRLGLGKFASYGIWQHYWENIHEYFNLFNVCRKAEKKGDPYPNTAFVEFFLSGMLKTINRLHDRANQVIGTVLQKNYLNEIFHEKKLNRRQYTIMLQLSALSSIKRNELNQLPWYMALYDKLTKQTKSRDLHELQNLNLIVIEANVIKLIKFTSPILLSEHPDTQS